MNKSQTSLPEKFFLGLRAYNRQDFFEAHEHFEDAWRQYAGDEREFFRAFLHLSGGFYRLTQDRPEAARKFFTHAQKWLVLFHDSFHGFDVTRILDYIQQLIEAINEETPPDVILQDQFQPIQPGKGSIQ